MSVEIARVEHLVREGRVEQSVVVGVVEDDRWLLPGRSCAHVKSAAFVLCVGPRAARGSCSWGRWCASMDDACAGSRGASFTEHSLAPKKSIRHRGRDPVPSSAPGPGLSSGSSRRHDAVRGPRAAPAGPYAPRGHVRLPTRADTSVDSEGTGRLRIPRRHRLDGLHGRGSARGRLPGARAACALGARAQSIFVVSGCAPPNTRRAVRPASPSIVTASRRSSSVALGSP